MKIKEIIPDELHSLIEDLYKNCLIASSQSVMEHDAIAQAEIIKNNILKKCGNWTIDELQLFFNKFINGDIIPLTNNGYQLKISPVLISSALNEYRASLELKKRVNGTSFKAVSNYSNEEIKDHKEQCIRENRIINKDIPVSRDLLYKLDPDFRAIHDKLILACKESSFM